MKSTQYESERARTAAEAGIIVIPGTDYGLAAYEHGWKLHIYRRVSGKDDSGKLVSRMEWAAPRYPFDPITSVNKLLLESGAEHTEARQWVVRLEAVRDDLKALYASIVAQCGTVEEE